MVGLPASHVRGTNWVLHSACVIVGKSFFLFSFFLGKLWQLSVPSSTEGCGLRTLAGEWGQSTRAPSASLSIVLWRSPRGGGKKCLSLGLMLYQHARSGILTEKCKI